MLMQRAKIAKSNHEEKEQIWRAYTTTYHIMVTKTLWYLSKYILSGMTMDIMGKNEEFRHIVSHNFFYKGDIAVQRWRYSLSNK